jgi:hypothetical protein
MSAATLACFAKAPHKIAARAVLDTLTIGEPDACAGLAVILRARLTAQERQTLAWAVLRACDDDEALDVAEAVIPAESRAGWPVVPLEDVVEEAAFWADQASPAELRAYAGVCLSRLSDRPGKRSAA